MLHDMYTMFHLDGSDLMARVVLGYSGLDGSAEHLLLNPDLVGFERRIFQGMDAAAAYPLPADSRLATRSPAWTSRRSRSDAPGRSCPRQRLSAPT